jgi:isoleucyl-tRNA synthetase
VVSKDKKTIQAVKDLKEILLAMCNSKKIEVVNKEPKGEFSEVEFSLGKIFVPKKLSEKLLDEALLRELVREIQDLRKKGGFEVREKILLTLSSDEKTNKILEKNIKFLKREVGAIQIKLGKLKGKYIGLLRFENKEIRISFDRK